MEEQKCLKIEIMNNERKKDKEATECVTDLDKLNLVKILNSGLVLGSSPFSQLPQLPQK